jgi:hypothetical protein
MPLMTIRAKRLSNAIIRNTITAQEFDDLVSADGRDIEFADLMVRPGQLSAVIASPTAMAAVAASSTAMAAVAASSTAMNAVIASPTAMAAVAASPTAMNAVGASPTAMAAVIASPTATDAFYNSPHIVSVPTMSSNSTPSGLCIASSEQSAGEAAWKAFDGIVGNTNADSVWGAATGNPGEWVGYQFTQPVRVSRCLFSPNGGSSNYSQHNVSGIEVQGEFGGVWTTVASTSLTPGTPATTVIDFSSAQAATKWRVRSTTAAQSNWWRVTRVDFLGVAA